MKPKLLNRLKVVRTARDLTQEQLADAAGLTRQTVSDLERGEREPSLSTALKLASVLGVEVSEIFRLRESQREKLEVPEPEE